MYCYKFQLGYACFDESESTSATISHSLRAVEYFYSIHKALGTCFTYSVSVGRLILLGNACYVMSALASSVTPSHFNIYFYYFYYN